MEFSELNNFELKHINFLLNFINSNKKIAYSVLTYVISLYEKSTSINDSNSFNLLINEFQSILDENTQNEENLKLLKQYYSIDNLTDEKNSELFGNLSKTQNQIYDAHLKLNNFIPKLFDYVDNNVIMQDSTPYDINFANKSQNEYLENSSSVSPLPLLLISEKTNTVTLPRTGKQIPLSRFKHSSWSRFREAFNLMRNVEKASLIKSLDLALELSVRYDLHPAIIAACKNIDELDVYLSCLDNNTTKDFPFFEISFEVSPI